MAKCARPECKRTAEVAPKLTVPHAIGVRPVSILLGIKTCRRCCMELDAPAEARLPNLAEFIQKVARSECTAAGALYAEPAFDRATVKAVKLNSEEYRKVAPRLERPPMPASEMTKAERLVSVAIKRGDDILAKGFLSHYALRESIGPAGVDHSKHVEGDVDGFLTSEARFVERPEAKMVAIRSGQIPESWKQTRRDLLSSDVNW